VYVTLHHIIHKTQFILLSVTDVSKHSAKYISLFFVRVQDSLIQDVFISKKGIRKEYVKSVVGNLDHGLPLSPLTRGKACLKIEGSRFQDVSNKQCEILHKLYEKMYGYQTCRAFGFTACKFITPVLKIKIYFIHENIFSV